MNRLQEKYKNDIVPVLRKELGRENIHSLPKLDKIVISMGVGSAIQDRKRLEEAFENLKVIAGQHPLKTRAKKSVAAFRLREGMEIGCCVTLRKRRMYDFLDRLITLALPRVRDFRGLNPNGFDGNGNYNMGLNEQVVFPEIKSDKVQHIQGMNITIVTSAMNNDEGRSLLKEFGMPFRVDK
ncbi:50S ribosomal protein L5 [Polystyrenella longa]|uniref:Large ribosomal subunit protein uL5 n=1 Tax=Polystyrenella longa TaxID=2528007 RepID=A0A518CR86_9PLAN|nr:50S ribosomal protein L5 [Polystyrenella longa]QDU81737.1 50S ribosomal protein L5 [Polystyrenella longa]